MLRPLDESLIDFQKTYRQIFKQPLYEHEQYTKRQLIYNYAQIGSEFINQLILKKDGQVGTNLEEIIKQWNDKGVTIEQIVKNMQKSKMVITLNNNQQTQSLVNNEQQVTAFTKQILVVKKDKIIFKSRIQRNVNYRKEFEILFKLRNINMLNVQSMKNHFNQLKPYNHYHSKNKTIRYQDNYLQKGWAEKYPLLEKAKYQPIGKKYLEEEENGQQNFDRPNSSKREAQNNNYKSLSERYSKEVQRMQYAGKREETISFQVHEREPNLSPRYKSQSQYQFRPPVYFPPPPQQPYSAASQYDLSPQYTRPVQEQGFKKHVSHEQGSGHNQFYQQNFPKPIQGQTNTSSNNTYFSFENSYRGNYGGNKGDLKGQYRSQ